MKPSIAAGIVSKIMSKIPEHHQLWFLKLVIKDDAPALRQWLHFQFGKPRFFIKNLAELIMSGLTSDEKERVHRTVMLWEGYNLDQQDAEVYQKSLAKIYLWRQEMDPFFSLSVTEAEVLLNPGQRRHLMEIMA